MTEHYLLLNLIDYRYQTLLNLRLLFNLKKIILLIIAMQKKAPPFLIKTYEMLEKHEFNDTIRWNEDESGFIIQDVQKFSSNILPNYFKHKNMHSYIRQLNMYGFSKKRGKNINYYYHPFFVRKQPELISQIQRRVENKMPKNNKNSNVSIQDSVPEQPHLILLKLNQMLVLQQIANLRLIENQIIDDKVRQQFSQLSSKYLLEHSKLIQKLNSQKQRGPADTTQTLQECKWQTKLKSIVG